MFFDGSAIVLQLASTILYLAVHIPSMRTFCKLGRSTANSSARVYDHHFILHPASSRSPSDTRYGRRKV